MTPGATLAVHEIRPEALLADRHDDHRLRDLRFPRICTVSSGKGIPSCSTPAITMRSGSCLIVKPLRARTVEWRPSAPITSRARTVSSWSRHRTVTLGGCPAPHLSTPYRAAPPLRQPRPGQGVCFAWPDDKRPASRYDSRSFRSDHVHRFRPRRPIAIRVPHVRRMRLIDAERTRLRDSPGAHRLATHSISERLLALKASTRIHGSANALASAAPPSPDPQSRSS